MIDRIYIKRDDMPDVVANAKRLYVAPDLKRLFEKLIEHDMQRRNAQSSDIHLVVFPLLRMGYGYVETLDGKFIAMSNHECP